MRFEIDPKISTAHRLLSEHFNARAIPHQQPNLAIDPTIGPEGFRIEDAPDGVRIVGNDERGVIYGVGKFLRDPAWRGTSVPKLPVRGIYFATHFHNFYHDAPIELVQRYVEDLALWGINSLTVWFDMHHFDGIKDPAAQAMLDRLKAIFGTARSVEMDRGLVLIANEGYNNSPVEMRATGPGRGGFYKRELCPNAPGAEELILRQFEEELDAFSEVGINHVWIWPYDQGSCSCGKCKPWGSNGFLKIARPVADLARKRMPGCKVYLSAWYMDDGEWAGVSSTLEEDSSWADGVVLQPDHFGTKKNAASPLPIVGFPEISMAGMYPWGGFGANPQPDAFQKYWDEARADSYGGWPYSEGIFEDINKAIFAQFYWDPHRPAWDTVREYAAFEFGADVAEDVVQVIRTLEQNHHVRWWPALANREDPFAAADIPPQPDPGAEEAYELAKHIDSRLSVSARRSWRWRIVYLRALLDAELKMNGGEPNAACQDAFQELTRLYHAGNAWWPVKPPAA